MSSFDLVPRNIAFYFFLLLVGLGAVCGLEYAYFMISVIGKYGGNEIVPLFDLQESGNLAQWFLSAAWCFSGMVCYVAYRISKVRKNAFPQEQHQTSDLWLWAVFGSLLLSADAVCPIRTLIRSTMIKWSGTMIYDTGEVWWIAAYSILFGMIGSRLLVEIRNHLPSCNALFLGVLCHILAVCTVLHVWDFPGMEPWYGVVLKSGLELTGTLFVLFSFSIYTRKLAHFSEKAVLRSSASSVAANGEKAAATGSVKSNPTGNTTSMLLGPSTGITGKTKASKASKETKDSKKNESDDSEATGTSVTKTTRTRSRQIIHPPHRLAAGKAPRTKKWEERDEEDENESWDQFDESEDAGDTYFETDDTDEDYNDESDVDEEDADDEQDEDDWRQQQRRRTPRSRTRKKRRAIFDEDD